ncbi:succinyl-diaminopimelate desuccinylase [Brachybacterium phenoliresistens]|uniref:Succinyl-diaminopimelate desuccinylase n=1 Tax=Brachybacterium phenoliresistens TaxID=396014 RepID=Z9JRP5_9MICO|nr:succinyl-diaminopimelate desuccinylase [Brachybacterium phenoliresistens]EWS80698.1 succinyl-diaminopimelate desuccinylase [Brachybacterium phenoliresistens]
MTSADPTAPAVLDPRADIVELTAAIVDIESVSGNEKALADAVELALKLHAPHLSVLRDGDTVIARTELGRAQRVVLAGHLDTVPVADNLPSRRRVREGREELVGRGTCDMKGGVAVFLALAVEASDPPVDLTWIFYDHEEVAAADNSLTRIAAEHPEHLRGDFAILGEPTSAGVEGGCKGTMKLEVTARGVAAHSARDWVGVNAVHRLAPVLERLAGYRARRAVIDGLEYRECLNAVAIDGGIAGNVIPDRAHATLNYRFAPDTSVEQAEAHVREVLAGLDVEIEVSDAAAGALPGLDSPAAQEFLAALGGDVPVAAKQGWTDVARFSALGTPAVNFGPGDPLLAHTDDEHVPTEDLRIALASLRRWLGLPGADATLAS